MPESLGTFDGKPVKRTSLIVRKTGDGLSKAMETDPQIIHSGERRFVLYEIIGDKIRHDPIDNGMAWCRVHITNADTVALVDEEFARDAIEQQRDKNRVLEDERKGALQLTEPGLLATQHVTEGHARKVRGCPDCYPPKPAKKAAGKTTGASKPTKGAAKKRALQSVK